MNRSERDAMLAALDMAFAAYGAPPPDTAKRAFVAVLDDRPGAKVVDAIKAHLGDSDRGRYPPKPADIVYQLEKSSGLDVDAAWDLAVREDVWNEHITLAVPKAVWAAAMAAEGSWSHGDHVAARMAFKAAYAEKLREFGDEMFVSRGYQEVDRNGQRVGDTPDETRTKIEDARARGYLSDERAEHLLPPPREDNSIPMPDHIREQINRLLGKWMDVDDSAEVRQRSNEAQRKLRARWGEAV